MAGSGGDASWKKWERRVARAIGGSARRRGPQTSQRMIDGRIVGLSDVKDVEARTVSIPGMSVECKLLGSPAWSSIQRALDQAELASDSPDQLPIAFINKKYCDVDRAVVVIRLGWFERFFGLPVKEIEK